MRIDKKIACCFLLAACLCYLVLPLPAGAHALLMEKVEEGVIKVHYGDGRFSMRTEVIAYDDQDREIMRGMLDEKGYFHYPAERDIVLLVADDGLGHRAEYIINGHHAGTLPMGWTVSAVVGFFIALALFFNHRTRERRE